MRTGWQDKQNVRERKLRQEDVGEEVESKKDSEHTRTELHLALEAGPQWLTYLMP